MAPRLVPCAAWIVLLPACSQLQLASAGEVGCAPGDIEVFDVERKWGAEAWRAVCGERVFQCSSVATAQAVDYSCAPLDEAPPQKEAPAEEAESEVDAEDSADDEVVDEDGADGAKEAEDDGEGSDGDEIEEPDDEGAGVEDDEGSGDEATDDEATDDEATDATDDPPSGIGR